jgi:molybdopterin synthase catalytic subunit
MIETFLTPAPLEPGAILERLGSPGDGALLLFAGTVRHTNEGRPVDGMRYEAYGAMAERVLREIAEGAAQRWPVTDVVVAHRTGELRIGEVSVVVGVASPHRNEAFEAGRHIMEDIKSRLPVWKQEHYVEGSSAWLQGRVPPVPEATHE